MLFDVEDIEMPAIDESRIADWVARVVSLHQKELGDISYIFCSDKKILEINNEYLKHDYYTDIITFDYTEDSIISGDIFISLDTVRSNAEQYKTDYNEELHRVMIHGILHLCGFCDETDEEEKQMRALENEALKLMVEEEE